MATSENALFLGNLRPDLRVGALKQNIIHMFHQLGATVTKNSIQVVSKPHSVYAFVCLATEEERDIILDLLNSANILRDLDLADIAKDEQRFKVAPKLERWQLASGNINISDPYTQFLGPPQHGLINSHGASSQWSESLQDSESTQVTSISDKFPSIIDPLDTQNNVNVDPRKTYTKVRAKPEEHYYVKREKSFPIFPQLSKSGPKSSEVEISKSKLPLSGGEKGDDELDSDDDIVLSSSSRKSKKKNNQKKKRLSSRLSQDSESNPLDLSALKKVNANAASDPNRSSGFFHRDVYVLNERLGNENRMLEFKRGQGEYVHRQLQEHVSIYMSAFLNTEGGNLLIGVNDQGEVKGIDIDRTLEDFLRREIDATIKRIRPNVFPNMYQLDFVQVVDSHSQPLGERQVIEVSVTTGTSGQLYQTASGDVYVRRDGSIQGPLQAADIQEWTRMMLFEEQKKKDNEINNLREKEKQLLAELEEHRANEERLAAQLECFDSGGKRKKKGRLKNGESENTKVCSIV